MELWRAINGPASPRPARKQAIKPFRVVPRFFLFGVLISWGKMDALSLNVCFFRLLHGSAACARNVGFFGFFFGHPPLLAEADFVNGSHLGWLPRCRVAL